MDGEDYVEEAEALLKFLKDHNIVYEMKIEKTSYWRPSDECLRRFHQWLNYYLNMPKEELGKDVEPRMMAVIHTLAEMCHDEWISEDHVRALSILLKSQHVKLKYL